MGPPNQGFDADDVAGAQVELGLVEHGEIAVIDRMAEFAEEPDRSTAF